MQLAVLTVLSCVLASSLALDCPASCTCSEGSDSVARCSELHSGMMFPERVKRLVVQSVPDLQINLTRGFFTNIGLQQALSIKIANCSIAYIDARAFEGLLQLNDVNLSNNGLILIHPDTFSENVELKHLSLSGNPLQLTQLLKAEENYFLKSSSLLELDLSCCQLSDIDKKLLSEVGNLQYLSLKDNDIKVIDTYIFENVPLLDEVDLSFNKLISLNDVVFEDIEELTSLNLRNNMIENIDNLELPGLKELDLSFNNIKLLKKGSFEGVPDLSSLNISHNSISYISEETFKDLTELKHLDLSNNALMGPLAKFTFETNEYLETLSLAGNKDMHIFDGFSTELPRLYKLEVDGCGLTTISNSSFNGMPNLAILNISMNSLTALNHLMMSKLHRLNILDASYNDISKVGTYTFVSNAHLRKLDLSHNRIHSLTPNTFETTPYLSHLDISYNDFTHIWSSEDSSFMKEKKFLDQLEYLNIAGNRIKELHKHGFDHLTNLKAINIEKNPLVCTAEFPNFIEWLYHHKVSPSSYTGPLAELKDRQEAAPQWDGLLMELCEHLEDKVVVDTKPMGRKDQEESQKIYKYTVIQDVKLDDEDAEVVATDTMSLNSMSLQTDTLAEEINTYMWPSFLIGFTVIFLILAIGNTIALLIYRHRNLHGHRTSFVPFKRTVTKLDTTPRYHKLYEECSVPNTPIVKGNLIGNLVTSHIKGTVLLKSKEDNVV